MSVKSKIDNNTSIINGINQKLVKINTFVRPLSEIGTNNVDLSLATATSSDIASGKKAYGVTGLIVGTHNCASVNAQSKTVTPITQSQTVMPDNGYTHLSSVIVNAIPSDYIIPSGNLDITENGVVDCTNYASVTINVASSGGSNQNITFDSTTGTLTIVE